MKIWSGALPIALGAIACIDASGGVSLTTTESEEIGLCGPGADPFVGVVCRHDFARDPSVPDGEVPLVGAEVVWRDGVEHARCRWGAPCAASIHPRSDTGAACARTLGTGCDGPTSATGKIAKELLLPAGTLGDAVEDFCKQQPVDPLWIEAACDVLDEEAVRSTDTCCVARTAGPSGP
jgi:hypothetical protein